jgi:hypothetical protein
MEMANNRSWVDEIGSSNDKAIEFFRSKGMLKRVLKCPNCFTNMSTYGPVPVKSYKD